jgi:hypothetical protein
VDTQAETERQKSKLIMTRKMNNDNGLQDLKTEHKAVTRNIRKPEDVGVLNFCTFTQNCNGLISWNFEIPASAYRHR